MGISAWQKELLSTLTRLDASVVHLTDEMHEVKDEMREVKVGMREMKDGMREMKDDIRMLTRVVVRRFGTAGTTFPQTGDHVLFHIGPDVVLPAVVITADGERLDLEVFGTQVTAPDRFPRNVPQGTAPGCWSFPT